MDNINEEKIEDILSDEIDLEDSDSTEESNSESSDAIYYLNSGEALNSKETYEITAREKTKLVVLAGLAGSGKTTIETSLYQMFQKKTVGGFYFAGSNTIQGYEQRAFFTRTKSRGTTPTTQRTSLEIGRSFLHLRLWERETDEFCNLLFADLSGEAFETHIGRVDEVKQDFPFMDRADYFVGVLDGEMINNKRKRNGAVAAMIELARTFYDAELVGRGCVLQIVFSKCDVFSDDIETILKKVEQRICEQFKNMFLNIQFYRVAAMPEFVGKFEVGYGIEELLKSWMEKKEEVKGEEKTEIDKSLSEFDSLFYKLLGGTNE